MSAPLMASTAQQAIDNLADLPHLKDAGLAFTAVGPDKAGSLVGFEIKLTNEAQEAVAEIAEATRKLVEGATLLSYGPAVLIPPQHWMHVTQQEAATLEVIQGLVEKQDRQPFDAKADYAENIRMLGARFTTKGDRTVTFYRIADSMLRFRKSRYLGLLQQGEVYGRLEPTDVLLLRADFDVVVTEGYAFFAKKSTFERAFGFLQELHKESLSTFNQVTSKLRIKGMDALRDACTSQPQMMAKMASIRRSMDKDADYAKAMTMSNLIEYIEKHPHVDIDIVGAGDDRELAFDPKPARRFQILKLLDDDFLHSVLTERDYEAGSKVQS